MSKSFERHLLEFYRTHNSLFKNVSDEPNQKQKTVVQIKKICTLASSHTKTICIICFYDLDLHYHVVMHEDKTPLLPYLYIELNVVNIFTNV